MGLTHRFPKTRSVVFEFLEQLAANSRRTWFTVNKTRYEELVLGPALGLHPRFNRS